MMRKEATWLGRTLAGFGSEDLGSVLSIGSGTEAFRRHFQPWIDERVFDPLVARGVTVLHHELHPAPGIDVSGDLADPAVRDRLVQLGVRTVLCLNVLEHILDRRVLIDALFAAVPHGGLVVATVPRRFPYHPDPIDTLFRPSAKDLTDEFSEGCVLDSGTVVCESLAAHWLAKPGKWAAAQKAFRGRSATGSPTTPAPAVGTSVAASDPAGPSAGVVALTRMAFVSTEVTYVVARRR